MTPTFLDGAVQDVAFEKPEGASTVRRRHHARFWQTNMTLMGSPVWVATASFDSRLEIGTAVHFAEEMGDKGPQASTVRMPSGVIRP